MKIKVASDLHTENLSDFKFLKKGDYDALFLAGDISTREEVESHFLTHLSKPVFAVAGNHLGYKFRYASAFLGFSEENSILKYHTHEGQIKELVKKFKGSPNIHYLQNEYVEFGDYIVFGGTMYTNFELLKNFNTSCTIKDCMKLAQSIINDFHVSFRYSKTKGFIRLTPQDYVRYFNTFMKRLSKCLEETTKNILVLTHFCPTIDSISERYPKYDEVNAYFASDLKQFILDNPRIKLWIHGHTHSACDYMVGNCRVVCNPFGYLGENYVDYKDYKEVIVEVK